MAKRTMVRESSGNEAIRPLLPRVVLDDELFVDGRVDLLADGSASTFAVASVSLNSSHSGWRRFFAVSISLLEQVRRLRAVADRDHVAGLHDDRRHVDDAAVEAEVAVRDELARLRAARARG